MSDTSPPSGSAGPFAHYSGPPLPDGCSLAGGATSAVAGLPRRFAPYDNGSRAGRGPRLGRHLFLAAAAELTTRPAAAGPVFMELSQSALDDAYIQSVWAPDAQAIIAGYGWDSAAVRAAMPPRTGQADTFTAVLAGMGRLHARAVVLDLNQFQVPNQLNDAGTPLSRAVLGMMPPARAGGG